MYSPRVYTSPTFVTCYFRIFWEAGTDKISTHSWSVSRLGFVLVCFSFSSIDFPPPNDLIVNLFSVWQISLFASSIFFYLSGAVVWLLFASSKLFPGEIDVCKTLRHIPEEHFVSCIHKGMNRILRLGRMVFFCSIQSSCQSLWGRSRYM